MNLNSRIAVTGANGLAGSAVVEHFYALGYTSIIPITRDMCDLRDIDSTRRAFYFAKPEYVFHAAATVYGLLGNINHQGKSILDNTLINTSVIEACRQAGSVRKIIAMGSNCGYPWPTPLPFVEKNFFDGRPDPGEAAYGHAKRHMLAMLEAYHDSYGTEYVYLISGNLFGPRDKFDPVNGHVLPSLVHKFYEASLDKRDWRTASPVEIWGDGSAERDFLYSGDLANLVAFFMGNNFTGPINIGSGITRPIHYVAKRLSAISGVDYSRVEYDKSKPLGRPICYPDLSMLRALGWKPQTDFADGLKKTFDWYAASRERGVISGR